MQDSTTEQNKEQNKEKEKKVLEQKIRLEQKKNRLIIEETRLKIKERKARTRNLIELGGLIVKAIANTSSNTPNKMI